MKIVSLDIETTSLVPKDGQVLQLGAVVFDTHSEEFTPIATWCKYIAYDALRGNATSIQMNIEHIAKMNELNKKRKKYEWLLQTHRMTSYENVSDSKEECKRICEAKISELCQLASEFDTQLVTPDKFVSNFDDWVSQYGRYTDINGKKHLNFCGKNIYKFDIPFLEANFDDWSKTFRPHYRTIDPCGLFCVPSDLCPPSLGECKKRAIEICNAYDKYSKFKGLFTEEVTHDALDDALDVAKLIWFYFKLHEPVGMLLVNL